MSWRVCEVVFFGIICNLLFVTVHSQPPTNDLCENATPISWGWLAKSTFPGTTLQATSDLAQIVSNCGVSTGLSNGVWYRYQVGSSLELDGVYVSFTTCGSNANSLDTVIHVFSGSCGALSCVAANDAYLSPGGYMQATSAVTLPAIGSYYILVGTNPSSTNSFTLTVFGGSNDNCFDFVLAPPPALTIGTPTRGSTYVTTPESNSITCGGQDKPGVWFTFTTLPQSGLSYSIATVPYDFAIRVMIGSCSQGPPGYGCVAMKLEGPPYSLPNLSLLPSTTYYVLISSAANMPSSSTFTLLLFTNDLLSGAQQITSGVYDGLNYGATYDPGAGCADVTAGVWYRFNSGSFSHVTVDTCASTSLDTVLRIMYPLTSETYRCLAQDDNAPGCGTSSRISNFTVVSNLDYYILVGAYSMGSFKLSLSLNTIPPRNDLCSRAITLQSGSSYYGTNSGATNDFAVISANCLFGGPALNGVWYTFNSGTFNSFSLNSCNSFPAWDNGILLFTGSCGSLTCVAWNDNGSTGQCGALSALFNVLINPGTTYYVLVGSANPTAAGPFTLQFTLSNVTPTPTTTKSITSTSTNSLSSTPTPSVTSTISETPSVTGTSSETRSVSSTPSGTASSTGTNTNSPTQTSSNTLTASPTSTNTLTATTTPTPTNSPTATGSSSPTSSNTPSNSDTNTPTSSNTLTATPTSSETLTSTPTGTPSTTETLTATPTSTNTPTSTSTETLTSSPTATGSDTPSITGTPTSSDTPSNTGTSTSTLTASPTRTRTPTKTPSASSTRSRTPTRTGTPLTLLKAECLTFRF